MIILIWIIGAMFTMGYLDEWDEMGWREALVLFFWWPAELGHAMREKS